MYFKLVLAVLVMQSFASIAFGAVSVSLNTENKEHPGKCWVDEHKQAIDINKSWQPPNECVSYGCGSDFSLDIIGCGAVGLAEGQHIVQDLSKPHPECCPSIAAD